MKACLLGICLENNDLDSPLGLIELSLRHISLRENSVFDDWNKQ